MAARWLVNLLLAVLVVGLAVLVRQEFAQEVRTARLTPLQPERIERVELRRSGEPAIVLVRRDGGWRMLEPMAAPADAAAVARLLPIAAAPSRRALPVAAADLGALGLSAPAIRLLLDGVELRFGAHDPIDIDRYVQVGDLIHLIEDRFSAQLLAAPAAWLDRRLLPAGFSPGLGSLDGRPLSAALLAGLVGVEAARVEPFAGELEGAVLRIESADGDAALRFLVADAGRRFSRLDQRLTWVFAEPPLALFGAAAPQPADEESSAQTNPPAQEEYSPPMNANERK